MDATLESVLRQPGATLCTLVRIELQSGVLRLTDGGFAVYNTELYLGAQPGFGALKQVGQLSEGGVGAMTRVDIVINGESQTAVAALCDPLNQTGLVQWWEGAMHRPTGALWGTPELKFQGQYDIGRFVVNEEGWTVTLECGTEGERQMMANSDWRLNPTTHEDIWPGETGLRNVTWLDREIYWRKKAPKGAITTVVGGGGGTGGGTNRRDVHLV
jgi:hypothetical protein